MDRRTSALAGLILFAVATVVAMMLDGSLPAGEESVPGWILQVIGYLAGITAGVLLLAAPGDAATPGAADRRAGIAVVAAIVVIALVDAVGLSGDGGANVGLGFLRLVALVVVFVVGVQQARAYAAERRAQPPTRA